MPQRLKHKEGVGQHHRGQMAMQALPAAPLKMIEATFSFGILIELLDREAADAPVPPDECQSGIVLSHRAVQSKENEISAAAAPVHPALVKGRILSTDAMHTQKKWCAAVHCYGGYYLTIVKKNHPRLYDDLAAFFLDPDAEQGEWQYAKKV